MSKTTLDQQEFRKVLGAFTTGVTIVTARGSDGEPVGVTANSFNSVSLDPPLVLWSLAKKALSLPVYEEAGYFAIHILASDQEDLSNLFACKGEDKFKGIEVENGVGNTPLLSNCTARLQCKTAYKYEGGDHIIFVGEVVEIDHSDAAPLVFQAGKYALASRKANQTPLISTQTGENSSFSEDFLGYLLWRAFFQFHKMARTQKPISEYSDIEFLTLVSLFHCSGLTMDDLASRISYEGSIDEVCEAIDRLVYLGLVQLDKSLLSLTKGGQEVGMQILTVAKSTESEFLQKLGMWESVTFKNLLKQFIVDTDPGLPHLWDHASTGSS